MHQLRTAAALAVTLAVLLVVPAAARSEWHADAFERATGSAEVAPVTTASPGACSDGAYQLMGGRWGTTLRWSFRAGSTPSGLNRDAVASTLRRSFGNIVNARNNCGRPDRVSATASYLGRTALRPSCMTMDGRNVVGFRALPSEVLARTCWWTIGGRIVEADIQINSTLPWATSLAACRRQYMLEAVMTHEVGHAFGLGHVGEARHGRLTMSTRLDGPCNNQEATLGLGDLRGLEAIY